MRKEYFDRGYGPLFKHQTTNLQLTEPLKEQPKKLNVKAYIAVASAFTIPLPFLSAVLYFRIAGIEATWQRMFIFFFNSVSLCVFIFYFVLFCFWCVSHLRGLCRALGMCFFFGVISMYFAI